MVSYQGMIVSVNLEWKGKEEFNSQEAQSDQESSAKSEAKK